MTPPWLSLNRHHESLKNQSDGFDFIHCIVPNNMTWKFEWHMSKQNEAVTVTGGRSWAFTNSDIFHGISFIHSYKSNCLFWIRFHLRNFIAAERQITYKNNIFSLYKSESQIEDIASAIEFCSSLGQEVAQGIPTVKLNVITTLAIHGVNAWIKDCYDRTEWVNGEPTILYSYSD